MINALIVDDEPTACKNLEKLLDSFNHDVKIVGTAHNTRDAELKINLQQPDVLFLDIQMPNENAFQFLERLGNVRFEIIFITAYDEFAIRAFKLNAVDYILKPINVKELENAVYRLKERISFRQFNEHRNLSIAGISSLINKNIEYEQLILRIGSEFEIVPFKDILFLEAMGSYSRFFYLKNGSEKSSIMARPITEYEELLPANIFLRVHKSYLINCKHIKRITKGEHASIHLNNNSAIPVARRRYKRIFDFLQEQNLSGE